MISCPHPGKAGGAEDLLLSQPGRRGAMWGTVGDEASTAASHQLLHGGGLTPSLEMCGSLCLQLRRPLQLHVQHLPRKTSVQWVALEVKYMIPGEQITSDSGSMLARLQIICPRQVGQDLTGTSSEDRCHCCSSGSCVVKAVSKNLHSQEDLVWQKYPTLFFISRWAGEM